MPISPIFLKIKQALHPVPLEKKANEQASFISNNDYPPVLEGKVWFHNYRKHNSHQV